MDYKVQETERNVIVLNRMFAGSYLHNNIGHEFINMYKDDYGKYYVYIMPQGKFDSSKFSNKIKFVFMVRGLKNMNAVEVLALAEIREDIYQEGQNKESQKEYIKNNKINYAGVHLSKIFENCQQQDIDISLQAASVKRPDKRVFLSFKEDKNEELKNMAGKDVCIVKMEGKQAKSSLKQYIEKGNSDYEKLMELIKDDKLWTKDLDQLPEVTKDFKIKDDNFFEICGIADFELAFSNALAYFIHKYPQDIVDFARIRGNEIEEFNEILREWKNIDLLLKNDKMWVVIENKITSKINGKLVNNGNKIVGDQLYKYYDIVTKEIKKEKEAKEAKFFLLTPDYNHINLSDYSDKQTGFVCEEIYTKITYSQIYAFIKDKHKDDPYFQEFVKGIEKHTKEHHNDLFEDLKNKLFKELRNIKSNSVTQ